VGETFTSIKIFGPGGSAELTSMVYTGATFTKIPKSVAEKVGIKTRRKVLVQLSTGELIEREIWDMSKSSSKVYAISCR
jgi:predicted aspartyl protease